MPLSLGTDTLDTGTFGQFHEVEKRLAAFKFVFGILQTTTFNAPKNESFSVSHAVYASEIINGTIKKSTDVNTINPTRVRTWVTQSGNLTGEGAIWSGSFSSSDEATTDNPNVEKIIVPMMKVQGTNNQYYFPFVKSGSTYKEDLSLEPTYNTMGNISAANLFVSGAHILGNWITPFKWGSAYKVKFFASNTTYTAPSTQEINENPRC